MKPSSAKQKKCRRCKNIFSPQGLEAICTVCSSTCVRCGITLTDDNRDTSALHKRKYYICKKCSAKSVRETRNKEKQKDYDLKRNYGISLEEYLNLCQKQQHSCSICGTKNTALVVDHDHKTGKVRELLCSSCNKGLGLFYDNRQFLQKAMDYLERYDSTISKK